MPSKTSSSSKRTSSTSKSSKSSKSSSSKSKSSSKSTTTTSKSSKKTDTAAATTKRSSSTNTTKTPFSERSEADQKLLLHQTAALLQFLERQGLQKSVAKLKTGLKKDLGAKFVGDDDDTTTVFPETPKGEWQFTKFMNYSSSEEEDDESSSSEYESSSSEEESSSGEYESSSDEDDSKSEYEEDMTDEEDDDKKKPAAAAKKKKTPPTRSKSFDADASTNQRSSSSPQRGVRRAVSFTDDKPTFHTIPKPSTDDKKRLYYDKHDIRRMRKEDAQEKQLETERKLKEAMAMASSTMGGVWLPGMKL